jgi:transposase
LSKGGFLVHRNDEGEKMNQQSSTPKLSAERVVRDIRRATRKQYSAEEKIRIVLDGLRGEDSIATICRREGDAESLYYSWSKEFLEAGKRRRGCRNFCVEGHTVTLRAGGTYGDPDRVD